MFCKVRSSISLGDVLSLVSEIDILTYYLGISSLPIVVSSPLRKDEKPSLGLYINSNKVHYHDFATGETGGLFDLLGKVMNVSFSELVYRIYQDIPKMKKSNNPYNKSIIKKEINKKRTYSKLECRIREFKDYDLEFWSKYGISKEWLIFGKIYPISHVIIVVEGDRKVINADKYAYCYVEFKDNNYTLKIYQPYNSKYKWSNNHNSSIWDLWRQLPDTGDNLIITSSRKDALCIWANTGIPSTSLQAESCTPKKKIVDILKKRFKNIYVLYDNDFKSDINHGRILGAKIAKLFDLKQIEIPTIYESKDSSDLFKNHGRDILQKVIKELINN